MLKRKILFILVTIEGFFLGGCAVNGVLISAQIKKEVRAPDPRAVSHFVDGVILDLSQNFAAALLSYQEALLYDSSSAALYLAIAKDYIRLGKEESALISLKRCLNLDPDKIEARDVMANIYVARKRWDLAEKSYREILARDSSYVDAYYSLALIYLQKNEVEKAIGMYRKILSSGQVYNIQLLLELGELYINLNRFEEAAEVYYQLIELDRGEGLGYYGLGMAKEALGDTLDAIDNYSIALQFNPDLIEARSRLSKIYLIQEQWDEAIRLYSEAVNRDSTDLSSWLELGEIYRQKGDTTAARKTIDHVKRDFPNDWRVYMSVGRIFLDQQEFEQARREFKKIIELSPQTFWGWYFTGICLVRLDSLESAVPYLKKAVELFPEEYMANYYLGSVLAQLNRSAEAIPYLETALRVRPDWVPVLTALADLYYTLNEYTVSDSLFQQALRFDPENTIVLNNYSYSLSVRGIRLEEAMRMIRKALEREPENGAYLDTMGWVYFKMGEYNKALEYIEKAIVVRSESAEVVEHLGDVYDKLGMKEKAREAWMKALELDENNPEILKKLDNKIEE